MPSRSSSRRDTFRVDGQDLKAIDRIRIRGRLYLILRELSTRGRYLAVDPDAGPDGQLRALLTLPRDRATQRHIRLLKHLSMKNDNLATIVDFQVRGDELIVVLDWIRGLDLEEFLDRVRAGKKHQPTAAHSIRLVSRLAHVIAGFHRRPGWIHGDIRPANLIITFDPSRLVAIDYGSAWGAPGTVHRPSGDGIDRAYSAPELQSPGQSVDSSCDQFSSMAVLYTMLTLEVPYDGLGGQAGRPTFVNQAGGSLAPPSGLCPDRDRLPESVWKDIDRVVERGLALDPADRYPTSGEWVNALQRLYVRTHFEPRLSPLNACLTRVVSWMVHRFGGQSPS